jgi:tRNA U34 5-methylaminomethyl-2-thiouridine-forming methyltransferase MnmC
MAHALRQSAWHDRHQRMNPEKNQCAPPSPSIWSERYQQHFHDRNGALEQAQHVFLEGSGSNAHARPRVLEIGFGLGLNFRTTLAACISRGVFLEYLAYEHDPQPSSWLNAKEDGLSPAILAPWQQVVDHWQKRSCVVDLAHARLDLRIEDASLAELPTGWASAIYLDGFSPAVNPELWSETFIERLALALAPGGRLATYSAAGNVRRALKNAGLTVERRPGWGSKWECLSAVKPLEPASE